VNFKKLAAATVGVGMALSATVVGFATPAAAASDCTTWKSGDRATGYAKCTGGNTRFSEHRVKVICISPRGTKHTIYGAWVSTRGGKTSKAVCTTDPVRTGIEVYRLGVETEEPI
jgi:hypothetical protein